MSKVTSTTVLCSRSALLAYVKALGADPGPWRSEWERLRRMTPEQRTAVPDLPPDDKAPPTVTPDRPTKPPATPVPPPAAPTRRMRSWLRPVPAWTRHHPAATALAAVTAVTVTGAILWPAHEGSASQSPGPPATSPVHSAPTTSSDPQPSTAPSRPGGISALPTCSDRNDFLKIHNNNGHDSLCFANAGEAGVAIYGVSWVESGNNVVKIEFQRDLNDSRLETHTLDRFSQWNPGQSAIHKITWIKIY